MNVSHVLEINVHFAGANAVIFRCTVFVNHAGPTPEAWTAGRYFLPKRTG